jgi:arsenate reductase (glutaredoxin)
VIPAGKQSNFLREHKVDFQEIPIRETPPSIAELEIVLKAHDGNLRRLFNTSGRDYKALGLSEKLPAMFLKEALQLLASNGNLVKRPFLIGKAIHLIGFDEAMWRECFLRRESR